ncbi:hypothetical protein ACGYK5_15300 [Sulfitobacter sp. 1A16787]|uniref:hypothetical protein n=1 Tax=Sulfitobacter sp. 1A16787 TaxID=3368571 RepID=UPI0037465493|tara:strand:+ start:202 stop:564 length:363 start_codon:yes stop_codon:yes gene_type:complete
MRKILSCGLTLFLAGCFPAEVLLEGATAKTPVILFYPGGDVIDDLLIVDGENHFGKAQYQIDDPMGDIGFRLQDGRRVQAECIIQGKDIIGQPECKRYEVYRSSFDPIPEGTQANRPSMF